MMEQGTKTALTGLRWTLGVVVLIESILFVMPGARREFAGSHLPDVLRLLLGWGEIVGAVLFLIPRTVVRGGWLLVAVFVLAMIVHMLHGMWNVGCLAIYAAAALAVIGREQGIVSARS
jgi:uncharacterized membrane protein YphA (DoxX/SURF4 family)